MDRDAPGEGRAGTSRGSVREVLQKPLRRTDAVIFFAYAHAREGKASKSASFARVAISLITLTH